MSENYKICKTCNNKKHFDNFEPRKSAPDGRLNFCKQCRNETRKIKALENKINAIMYRGGECKMCNLKLSDTHHSVFDFHHLDQSKKDVDPSTIMKNSWENVKKEISKCILLCANCHRLIHNEHAAFSNDRLEKQV